MDTNENASPPNLGSGPAAANARQFKAYAVRIAQSVGGWRISVPEGPDESSPARSAGFAFLKRYPSRMGRSTKCWQSLSRIRDQKPSVSIVPVGTDVSLCVISQHFVLGYFH